MPDIVKIKFRNIFKKASKNSEPRSNRTVSNEKEENVVKPPQNPMAINSFSSGRSKPRISKPNINSPIIKLPRTFTTNVPVGK